MTVGEKLHVTLTQLESAKSSLESYGLDTNDQQAKQMYFEMADELGRMVQNFKGRVNYAESQEAQYKVRQQAMQPKPQQ